MNTNQSNVSFQSIRVFCSKAKTRLLPRRLPALPERLGLGGLTACRRVTLQGEAWVTAENYQYYPRSDRSLESAGQPAINPYILLVTAGGWQRMQARWGQFRVVYAGLGRLPHRASPQCARFIDANGDSIYTTTTGQMSETADGKVKSIIEFHTVTGGTGFYTDAAWSFTVTIAHLSPRTILRAVVEGSFTDHSRDILCRRGL